jgi:hypothetical protein
VLDLAAAFELGCGATAPLAAASGPGTLLTALAVLTAHWSTCSPSC